MQMDITRHFDLNSCGHGVKLDVKQVDDNYTWLYNEHQYLYVELSEGSIGQLVTKNIVSHSFGGIDIRMLTYAYFVWAYLY